MRLPRPLQMVWDAWMALSKAIGFVMSRILLTVMWIVLIGPYAIVMKIGNAFGKKPVATNTYWTDCTAPAQNLHQQF